MGFAKEAAEKGKFEETMRKLEALGNKENVGLNDQKTPFKGILISSDILKKSIYQILCLLLHRPFFQCGNALRIAFPQE